MELIPGKKYKIRWSAEHGDIILIGTFLKYSEEEKKDLRSAYFDFGFIGSFWGFTVEEIENINDELWKLYHGEL